MKKIPLVNNLPRYISTLSQKIFTALELDEIVRDYAKAIRYELDAAPEAYIDWLVKNHQLRKLTIQKASKSRTERFSIDLPTQFALGLSLKAEAYLSHLSAAYIHGFLTKEPVITYISSEGQIFNPAEIDLEQEAIDESFENPQRKSGAELKWGRYKYLLLTARNTGRLGIGTKNGLFLTDPERTLIDLMVRPAYGNGAKNILEIFRDAIGKIQVSRLLTTLDSIPFIYPYHQLLGWYLSKAGYSGKYLKDLIDRPKPYRFYVEYEMKNALYSKDWNIFYPNGL